MMADMPDDGSDLAPLLRLEAELPLGLRARVEAQVTKAIRRERSVTWEERATLASVALCLVGVMPGALLVGPVTLVGWGVAALYGALLDVEDEPTS